MVRSDHRLYQFNPWDCAILTSGRIVHSSIFLFFNQISMIAASQVYRFLLLIFFFLCVVTVASGQTSPPTPGKSVQSSNAPAAAAPSSSPEVSKYVGAETCKTCHEEIYNAWEKTPHWKTTLNTKGGPSKQGCEGCHGPGADHVAGGGDKTKIFVFEGKSRQQTSARCLSCHGEAHEQSHFAQSVHSSNDIGCLDCHSPHHAKEKEFLLVKDQPQLCYGCHTSAKADFAKPYHHRVNEGLVQCVDCHNPHGTGTVRQLRSLPSGDFICYKCHVDKQGPFVYEHVPVKTEGCTSCHSPHGSTNPKLLNVMPVNMLCLGCHTFSSTLTAGGPIGPAHNQSAKYQACIMCHTQIHGSNFSSVFFK
jgi:DmsE family decaheme c-type cytochrome